MRFVAAFFRFWWEFVVGDDPRVAAGVAAVLGAGALLVAYSGLSDAELSLAVAAGIFAVAAIGIVRAARR
jgi:hypothetical protein